MHIWCARGAGKTNITSQLVRGKFYADSKATIGVEFASITFKVHADDSGTADVPDLRRIGFQGLTLYDLGISVCTFCPILR